MMHRVLWVVQVLLALLFLFSGGTKLVMPAAELTGQTPIPAGFLRFIGAMEILGGLGLVLPGLLHIQTALTPLAAAGLSLIMIGAVVVTIQTMGVALAALPFAAGVLALFVAYGRWRLAPLGSRRAAPPRSRTAQRPD
ncbi:MAG: DoxX family protein [Bryobacteraceae bacterium]